MPPMEMPPDMPRPAIIMLAENKVKTSAKATLELPWVVPNDYDIINSPENAQYMIDFASAACYELVQSGGPFYHLNWTSENCRLVDIVTLPKHGYLVDSGNQVYRYQPGSHYLGHDSVQFVIEGDDRRRIQIKLNIEVKSAAQLKRP